MTARKKATQGINRQNLQRDNRPHIRVLERYVKSIRQTGFPSATFASAPTVSISSILTKKQWQPPGRYPPRRNTGERTR